MNLFVCFLGEFEDTKSPFEIIWPLKCFEQDKTILEFGHGCKKVKFSGEKSILVLVQIYRA